MSSDHRGSEQEVDDTAMWRIKAVEARGTSALSRPYSFLFHLFRKACHLLIWLIFVQGAHTSGNFSTYSYTVLGLVKYKWMSEWMDNTLFVYQGVRAEAWPLFKLITLQYGFPNTEHSYCSTIRYKLRNIS